MNQKFCVIFFWFIATIQTLKLKCTLCEWMRVFYLIKWQKYIYWQKIYFCDLWGKTSISFNLYNSISLKLKWPLILESVEKKKDLAPGGNQVTNIWKPLNKVEILSKKCLKHMQPQRLLFYPCLLRRFISHFLIFFQIAPYWIQTTPTIMSLTVNQPL